MIDLKAKAFIDMTKLIKKMRAAIPKSLEKVGVIVRRDMRDSLNVDGGAKHKPSAPGTPPHRKKGLLRNSILFGMNGDNEVVIGSMPRSWGWYGRLHEHGGPFASVRYIPKKYNIGDAGPIRVGNGLFQRGKRGQIIGQSKSEVTRTVLETEAQVQQANMLNSILAKSRSSNLVEQSENITVKVMHRFPARPFARPALIRNLDKIPPAFKGIF